MINHKNIGQAEFIRPPSRDYHATKPIDLWWPFWAWRVIAPEDSNETDIFLELLLRLIKAGCHDRAKLATYSCLHEDFVVHLLALLTEKNWLDGWALTETGEQAVVEGYESGSQIRSYYLLQDPRTEKLVPRVFHSFDYVDGISIDEQSASYLISRQSGRYVRPFLLRAPPREPERPSVDSVYKAIRDHRLDRNRLKQAGINSAALSLFEDQVEFLDDAAFPVYMHMQLFSEPGGDRPWYLSDPASILPSSEDMNRIAEHWLETDKHFASKVETLLGIAVKEAATHDEVQKKYDEFAKARVIKEFSWVSKVPMVEKYVLLMIRDLQELEAAKEPKPWMLERVVSSLQKVCEAVVKLLSPPSRSNDEWKKVRFRDERGNREQIKAIYLCCKAVDDELAFNFSNIRSGQIRAAMEEGNQSLRQLLAALVLRMPEHVTQIDSAIPGWLNKTMALANSRNKAEHANDHIVDEEETYSHVEFVEKLLKYIEGSVANG